MYLLDTNSLIYFFKGKGRVSDHLFTVSRKELGLSAIVLHELETGIAKSSDSEKRRRQLDLFIEAVEFCPFGKKEAETAAEIRSSLEIAGIPIGPLETLIAGTACANKAILVTHNVSEFSRIPDLVIEDWY